MSSNGTRNDIFEGEDKTISLIKKMESSIHIFTIYTILIWDIHGPDHSDTYCHEKYMVIQMVWVIIVILS